MRSGWYKNAFVYLLILVAVIALFYRFASPIDKPEEIAINEVAQYVKEGKVEKISVSEDEVTIEVREGNSLVKKISRKEHGVSLTETLLNLGVTSEELGKVREIKNIPPSPLGDWMSLLITYLPLVGFGLLLLFVLRQAQSGEPRGVRGVLGVQGRSAERGTEEREGSVSSGLRGRNVEEREARV